MRLLRERIIWGFYSRGQKLKQAEVVCFRGVFTFAVLDEAAAERVIGGPLPEAWKKLAR